MKKNICRTVELLVMILCICFCITGCNSAEEELASRNLVVGIEKSVNTVKETLADTQVDYDECTLTLSLLSNIGDNDAIKDAISAFELRYPGIFIELLDNQQESSEGESEQELHRMTIADINQIEWEWLHEYSQDGSLYYDLYKEYKVLELGTFGQEYLNLCTVADSLQALPVSVSGKVFAFNESMYEKAGITVPNTLEELIAAGEVFESVLGDDYYPLAVNIDDRMELVIYYLETIYGRKWVDNGVMQYNVGEIEEALEFLVELEDAHVIPSMPQMKSNDTFSRDAGWSNGYYGGVFVSDAKLLTYSELMPEDGILAVADRYEDMGIFNGGHVRVESAFAVSSTCSNPREAALFLNFMFCDEQGIMEIADLFGTPLSRIAKSYCLDNNMGNGMVFNANAIALESDFLGEWDFYNAIEDDSIYYDVINGLSYGDYNAKEAAQIFMSGFVFI